MRAELDIPDRLGAHALDAALEGLTELAQAELTDPQIAGGWPTLYTSGVRYEREHGTERWQTPSQTIAAGRGDCEDLGTWRAAELRVSGEDPTARARVIRSGPRTWHVVVDREGGAYIEDPSTILGMGSEDEGSLLGWAFDCRKIPGGYQCTIMRDGAGVVGRGRLASQAIARACNTGTDVGQIPGLDFIARIAQGALSAALPPAPPTAARPTSPARPAPAPTSPARPTVPAYVPPPAPAADMSAEVARIARQISTLTSRETRRKLTAATSRVRGRR